MQVNMLEAKNQLSKLVKAALAGEEVIIANHGVPAVRLVAVAPTHRTVGWGSLNVVPEVIDAAFNQELDEQIAAELNNSRLFPES
jgi:prevent-host-death family protein